MREAARADIRSQGAGSSGSPCCLNLQSDCHLRGAQVPGDTWLPGRSFDPQPWHAAVGKHRGSQKDYPDLSSLSHQVLVEASYSLYPIRSEKTRKSLEAIH